MTAPHDWIREEIERELVVETEGWAAERVARVTERLQHDVPEPDRFETLVIWISEHNAFTAPGRTLYLGRRLLERLADDDATAFVIGHELAHQRLGHVPALHASWLPLRVVLAILDRRIAGPDNERDADLWSIERCLDAGYDLDRCVEALEHIDRITLDYGDVDGSLGPERPSSRWRRLRGYDSIRDRIAAVRAHALAYRAGGERVELRIARDREQRRARRKRVLAGVGAAAGVVALMLLRRRA